MLPPNVIERDSRQAQHIAFVERWKAALPGTRNRMIFLGDPPAPVDPEAKPIYRGALISIMVAGVVVLLWTGGVFGALGQRVLGPAVQLGAQTVRPVNPLECTPSPHHTAVITVQQQPDGSVRAYCKRYPILQGRQP